MIPGILDRIVATKRRELAELQPRAAALRSAAEARPAPASLGSALRAGSDVALIAEVKRRSPSAGAIDPAVSVTDQARGYERGGAAAVSVLTDAEYFGGSLADLEAVRAAVRLPLLRKDFTLDPVQIFEARAAGASAVLLIVRILEDARLRDLAQAAAGMSLDALVEVHDERDLERALAAGAELIGVNNRDLDVFTTDLGVTERLAPLVPAEALLVGESGIRAREDVIRLAAAGADAVLVGEALMRGSGPGAGARDLAGVPRRARAR